VPEQAKQEDVNEGEELLRGNGKHSRLVAKKKMREKGKKSTRQPLTGGYGKAASLSRGWAKLKRGSSFKYIPKAGKYALSSSSGEKKGKTAVSLEN